MPLYEFKCKYCNKVNEFVLFMEDLEKTKDDLDYDLSTIDLKCSDCGCTKFKKMMSAHGKCSVNWAKWSTQK